MLVLRKNMEEISLQNNGKDVIAFIISTVDIKAYHAMKENIDKLLCPDGVVKKIVWVKEAVCNGAVYNKINAKVPCYYKVHIQSGVRIVNDNFIADLLKVFADKKVAMVGFLGSLEKPVSGRWQHTVGKVLFAESGGLSEKQSMSCSDTVFVQLLDGRCFATQGDRHWNEKFSDNYFSMLSRCNDITRGGYKLAVPYQEQAWCQYDGLPDYQVDVKELDKYIESYAPYLQLPHENVYGQNMLYRYGRNCHVAEGWKFSGAEGVSIGDGVSMQKEACLSLPLDNFVGVPRIVIGNGCDIGRRLSVAAANKVVIADNVIIADNVYITDCSHRYDMVGVPIMQQGFSQTENSVIIGRGTCLENNVVVSGNVKVGRGCVITANSVVTQDIPPYCVAAGNPARVIKAFDYKKKKWLGINSDKDLQMLLLSRPRSGDSDKRVAIDMYIYEQKNIIRKSVYDGNLEGALQSLKALSAMLYDYNQYYVDDEMEQLLLDIAKKLALPSLPDYRQDTPTLRGRKVLFYDGFGLDIRGLAQIYLEVLVDIGCHVIYAVGENARGKLPTLLKAVERGKGEVVYLPGADYVQSARNLVYLMNQAEADTAFFYTTPWDVSAIIAFQYAEGCMTRYLINLTDHAFWLGLNTFDYCLEFRAYGVALSRRYRHIPAEKQLMQPYYPADNGKLGFGGLPFARSEHDFVIFSGGLIYKTQDNEHTYYKLVDWLLSEFPQVKFWFASKDSCRELEKLLQKFPGRMAHTPERKDLTAIMQNIDLYMDTYPMGGGLMVQFSAVAGKVFLSMYDEGDTGGLLRNEAELGLVFNNVDDWKTEARKLIEDTVYRKKKEKLLAKAVISREDFTNNLRKIISEQVSDIPIRPYPIEQKLGCLQRQYYDRFIASHVGQFEDY